MIAQPEKCIFILKYRNSAARAKTSMISVDRYLPARRNSGIVATPTILSCEGAFMNVRRAPTDAIPASHTMFMDNSTLASRLGILGHDVGIRLAVEVGESGLIASSAVCATHLITRHPVRAG